MTKIFITSDNHFFHRNIIKYCNRPFNSYQEMNEVMIRKWNDKVGKEDIVFHLGDFCLYGKDKARMIRKRLNGTIILISGNHDYPNMEDIGFITIQGNLQIGNFILSHKPIPLEELPLGFFNIFGHIHHHEVFDSKRQMNVSVEKTNYEPMEIVKNKNSILLLIERINKE